MSAHGDGCCGGGDVADPRYPSGEAIHAGDRIVFQGQPALVFAVLPRQEFAAGYAAADWDFMGTTAIGLVFDDRGQVFYDGFCAHDGIVLVSRGSR